LKGLAKSRAALGLTLFIVATIVLSCGLKGPPKPPLVPAPDKPRGLSAKAREGCVKLSWHEPREDSEHLPAFTYQVLRSIQEAPADPPAFRLIGETEENYFIDCSLDTGLVALYSVRAVSSGGEQGEDSSPARVYNRRSPAAPADLSISPGDDFVELRWRTMPGLPPGSGYNVYRSRDPEVFPAAPVNAVPVEDGYYVDSPLMRNETYYYEVRAVVMEDGSAPVEGPAAAVYCVTMFDASPPAPPLGLTAIWRGDGVMLRWFHNREPDVSGYVVRRRRLGSRGFKTLTPRPIEDTEFLDRSARRGVDYEYMVQAVDDADPPNISASSDVVRVFTGP